MKRTTAVLAAAVAVLLNHLAAQAQDRLCGPCLGFVAVAELSTTDVPVVPSTVQSVLRTEDGRFLVSHLFAGQPEFVVYDGAGDFRLLYGEAGQGPGEFRRAPRLYPGPGNQIWAVEADRLNRFDPELRHIDTRRLDHRISGQRVAVSNGYAAATQVAPPPSPQVRVVTILDSAGNPVKHLEAETDSAAATVLASAVDGGFWTLRSNAVLLRRYSTGGAMAQEVAVTLPHFQPMQGHGVRSREDPPVPRHYGLFDLGEDLVVIMTSAPDEDWAPLPQRFRPSELDPNRLYDTYAALVDLRTGRAIAVKRLNEYLHVMGGAPDLTYSVRQDSLGHVTTTVLRVQGRRP